MYAKVSELKILYSTENDHCVSDTYHLPQKCSIPGRILARESVEGNTHTQCSIPGRILVRDSVEGDTHTHNK